VFYRIRRARQLVQPSVQTIHITSRVLRLGTWSITYLLYKCRMTPDLVSILSIFSGLLATYFGIQGDYLLFAGLYFVWAILDCCDGELSRLYKVKGRAWPKEGAVLEPINSDVQYATMLPALAIGLLGESELSAVHVFFSLVSTAGYVSTRKLLGTRDKKIHALSRRQLLLFYSQTKSGSDLRDQFPWTNTLYILWRNALTQFGVFPILIFVASVNPGIISIRELVVFYTVAYGLFSIILIVAATYARSLLAPT
jgi:phosphatidylglycerophosphate synthase